MSPILFTFRRCPYAIRARLTLLEAGISYEKYEVVLKQKPAQLLALSPKGTVPVLWLGDQSVIQESLDIMRWALSQNDPNGWLKGLTQEHHDLVTQNDTTFKRSLDRYKYPNRYPAEQDNNENHQLICQNILMNLEQKLMQTAFLSGQKWGFVDTAIAPFVRQFAHVDKVWFDQQPWPHLIEWLAGFEGSSAFLTVMQR